MRAYDLDFPYEYLQNWVDYYTGQTDTLRPLQKSPSLDSRNLNKDFRLFLFRISTDSTQIPP